MMNEIPARRRFVAIGSGLRTIGHGHHLTAVVEMAVRGLNTHADTAAARWGAPHSVLDDDTPIHHVLYGGIPVTG